MRIRGQAYVHVYAASIAGQEGPDRVRQGRPRSPVMLRAALLFDRGTDSRAFEPKLPEFLDAKGNVRKIDAGHARDVSYAKCLGENLPKETLVACRVVPTNPQEPSNASIYSFGFGALHRYANKEVRHDFASCVIGAETLKWRRMPGPPRRLRMELMLHVPNLGPAGVVPLELCRVDTPLHQISFCSQPLYNLGALHHELPWATEDWLEFHLGQMGIERADIYDLDGSAADAVRPWLRARSGNGSVHYWREWPRNLSVPLMAASSRHPYCAETWAYAHCLTNHRALSRWVMLLHAPDEYVFTPGETSSGMLSRVLREYELTLTPGEPISMLGVMASSFARGPPNASKEGCDGGWSERGKVVSRSLYRSDMRYKHTAILDPATCQCSGPHMCYSESAFENTLLMTEVESKDIVVHHYVEMLDRNIGRCMRQHDSCDIRDESALWAAQQLKGMRARSRFGVRR